jgi:rubrerythrin
MDQAESLRGLIGILRLAYSGELAAGFAYRGHWHSISDPEERLQIRKIEDEEWHHRRLVGGLLEQLGARPSVFRETRAFLIGGILGLLCHVAGRFAPMYGAGRLESRNVREYEEAAQYARECGRGEFVDCLLTMAEVEWDHERYFPLQGRGTSLDPFLSPLESTSSEGDDPWFPPLYRERRRLTPLDAAGRRAHLGQSEGRIDGLIC